MVFFKNQKKWSIQNATVALIFLCFAAIELQHQLYETLYVIDRGALFFYPLFIVSLTLFMENLGFHKTVKTSLAAILALCFGINFLAKANFYKTALWDLDVHSEKMFSEINELGENHNKVLRLDFSWPFENSIGYYFNKNEYPYISIVNDKYDRESFEGNADVYIYLNRSLPKVGYDAATQRILNYHFETLKRYEAEHIELLRIAHN